MIAQFKSFLWALFEFVLVTFLISDIALAIYVGKCDGWEQGFYVGIPAYLILSILSPFIPGILWSVLCYGKDEIKGKINRGKKYQY